jgi:drug/metabolite transporter (DMT)-like permease
VFVVAFGLLAAVSYGVGDFVGAFASRRQSAVTVLLHSYPVGAVLMLLMLPFFPGSVDGRVIGFGIAGGLAGLVGVVIMYALMVIAPMNVISPVTAVLLVSRTTEDHPHGKIAFRILAFATLAGLGFGFYFIFLARAGDNSGLWPLVISRVASALAIVPLAAQQGAVRRVPNRLLGYVVLAGCCDALANMFFLLASRHGLLSLASVLTSLYPAVTVMLAVGLLHEHTSRVQRAGLALAAASIVLITV